MFIYKITNNVNDKCYVGLDSADKKFSKRWKQHKKIAKRNDTKYDHGSKLYPAMRKYGLENFTYEILDTCSDKEELFLLESHYIIICDSIENGYNIVLFHGIRYNKKWHERMIQKSIDKWDNVSDEDKTKYFTKISQYLSSEERSNIMINNWNLLSINEQNRRKLSCKLFYDNMDEIEKNKRNLYSVKRLAETKAKTSYVFDITSPNGTEYKNINTLVIFCKEHDLKDNLMYRAAFKSKNNMYKKWKIICVKENTRIKFHNFISPDNTQQIVDNVASFCREYNLNYSHVRELMIGKRKTVKKWRYII